jgi:leader peptidase (prepilin peptidase)/N-methyltransferase
MIHLSCPPSLAIPPRATFEAGDLLMANVRTDSAGVLDGHPRDRAHADRPAPLLRRPVPVTLVALPFAGLALITAPSGAAALLAASLAAVLVVLAATDLERRIIPNQVVLPAAAIALVANMAINPGQAPEFVLAALAGGAAFLIPNLISPSLMGMGDVKLMLLLGAGLGWGAIGSVIIAFISVFPFALWTLVRGGVAARKSTLPFGPFLALGGLVILIAPHLLSLG